MIIGKEQLIYFEKLAAKQERLYPDACDYGVILNDKQLAEARVQIKELMKELKYKVSKYNYNSETVIFFPVEMSDIPKMVDGIEMTILYSYDKNIHILTISFKRTQKPESTQFFQKS